MILLVDAHAILWWLADDPTLSANARASIRDPANEVLASAASVWEIEIKRALGKLDAPDDLVEALASAGFGALPITLDDAARAGRLPPHHRDPFDRMLVAQAGRLDAVIVTRDPAFSVYDVETLTA
jgi:PIN domain nuclease of toxin-antitoxin system